MAFDIEGARKAGYSDQEIADHLGKQSGFDVAGAKQAGYSAADILQHLTTSVPAQPSPQDDRSYVRSAAEGVLRSAASVGNTILSPVRAAANFLAPEETTVQTLVDGKKRRTGALAPVANYLAEMKDSMDWLDRENASNPTSYGAGRLVGDIAMTAPVGGFVGAGVKAAGVRAGLPVVERLGTAVATGGFRTGGAPTALSSKAADLGLRALGGGINGAATTGLIDPENMLAGAAVGAALPPAASAVFNTAKFGAGALKGVKRSFEPLNQANDSKIIGRVLREQAGPEADQAIAALRQYQRTGPQLPGYQPSGAEVARVPSLASMQRTATAVNPIAMNRQAAISASNQDAILRELDDLAGRGGERAFSDAMREETAQRLYDKAFSQPINPAHITPELQDQITKLASKPAMQAAMQRARELAKNEGLDIADPAGSLRGLHYSLQEIGGMVGDAKTRNEKRILMGVKNELTSILDRISPDYANARAEYEALSRPLDQFALLEKIAQGSTTGKGNATLSKFGTAATDKTAQAFTTKRNATLADVLTAQQLNRLGNVRGALEGIDFVGNAGRGTGSDTVAKLATANRLPGAGWVSRVPLVGGPTVGLLNRGLDAVYSNANRRLEEKLALGLLDPAQTLSFLEAAPAATARQPGLLGSGARKALPLAFRSAPLLLGQ